MGAYVFQITGRNLATDLDETFLFSMGRTISFTDHARAKSGLRSFDVSTQRIEVDRAGVVRSAEDTGEIVLSSAPRDIQEAGPWDGLASDYSFKDRRASIYWVPARVWADKTLIAKPIVEQPVADTSDNTVTFPIRDPRADLDAPLQTAKFAGDNIAPDGVEGGADLKGKPEPILAGIAPNFEAPKVNEQKLIYKLHDKAAKVICVRIGGVPLALSTIRANVASLQLPANAPPAGGYDIVSTDAEGTFVRLCNPPSERLTFDGQKGSHTAPEAESARTHAQIWKWLRETYCGTDPSDIDGDSVDAIDLACPHEVGFWAGEETTRRQAIDRVLASLSGFERQNLDGTWSIHRLEAPSGEPDLSLLMVTPDAAMTSADRAITSPPARARPSYAADGAPPYLINARWGFNPTVMNAADFAGSADQFLRTAFKDPWRIEPYEVAGVLDDFPSAPQLTIDTLYHQGDDGETAPHVADEAERLGLLYGNLRGQFEVGFRPKPTDPLVLPGKVIKLSYPGHGLNSGPLFVVLQGRLRAEGRIAEASVVLGLGSPLTVDSDAVTADSTLLTVDMG